ncbi:DUF6397 family protein [Streptomyces sp. NPDC050504]|uniref:DUF6397 family protein n=1 Tax=Streptomyces sp. NPDC050504 TaxID=3365618 RepID=UPI0037B20628
MTESDNSRTLAQGRAAAELALKRGEFELAVQLGHIRTAAVAGRGTKRRVPCEEVERLRADPGFPEALRRRVRTVGTTDGARLIGVGPDRFTRLARAGYFTPVRFYLNRYRAVVWLYLAEELKDFAAREPDLLTGRAPEEMRKVLAQGGDWRARNWRGRRVGRLLGQTDDPWERAAIIGAVLKPEAVQEAVPDPHERSLLHRLRPSLAQVRPESLAAQDVVEQLVRAHDPDEVLWQRLNFAQALAEARVKNPVAQRPAGGRGHGQLSLLARLGLGRLRRGAKRASVISARRAAGNAPEGPGRNDTGPGTGPEGGTTSHRDGHRTRSTSRGREASQGREVSGRGRGGLRNGSRGPAVGRAQGRTTGREATPGQGWSW